MTCLPSCPTEADLARARREEELAPALRREKTLARAAPTAPWDGWPGWGQGPPTPAR